MRVISTSPAPNTTDVVLGQNIEVVFDKPVDPATVTSATFALIGPGQAVVKNTEPIVAKEYITGTFSFPEPTRLVFSPTRPMNQTTVYTVIIAGSNANLTSNSIKASDGERLATSYTFKFTTGVMNLPAPPVMSPLPDDNPLIQEDEIRVIPRRSIGNDLEQVIEIHFPDAIDLSSIDPAYAGGALDSNPFNDVLVSLDALADDPTVPVPPDPRFTVEVQGNVLRIKLTP